MPIPGLVVHICDPAAWDAAQIHGEYRAASLESEGFIHASRPDQAVATANRYYRAAPPLLLLWIDPVRLEAPLRFDPVGEDTFPHIYGPVNLEAVVRVSAFPPDPDGVFRSLPGAPG